MIQDIVTSTMLAAVHGQRGLHAEGRFISFSPAIIQNAASHRNNEIAPALPADLIAANPFFVSSSFSSLDSSTSLLDAFSTVLFRRVMKLLITNAGGDAVFVVLAKFRFLLLRAGAKAATEEANRQNRNSLMIVRCMMFS